MSVQDDPTRPSERPSEVDEFLQASEGKQGGIFAEFIEFLTENKKWWLLPIVVVLAILGLLVFLGGTGLAPFIYTLF